MFSILVGNCEVDTENLYLIKAETIEEALKKYKKCSNIEYPYVQINKLPKSFEVLYSNSKVVSEFEKDGVFVLNP